MYELLPEDVEYLNANFPSRWKRLTENGGKCGLLIRNFNVPEVYTVQRSALMIIVPSGYPGTPLDMFYFDPPLERSNAPVDAIVNETHFGRDWQRWSRHYDWKPGEDNLVRHIEFVRIQLIEEAAR